ncbi:MAG: glycosyltransferase family 2 protein [Mucilaginibacter polytrichastri]|nr:glycosyltransferase family 2 protein [Mucilaginibacter polytrichastri]
MEKGVSILICTHNGAERLPETIRHIARQQTGPDLRWELVLGDNGSTDNSAAVVQDIWDAAGPEQVPFRVITEGKPGKLYALQKAIREARYEYLIICDDDNWLNPDYVQKVYDLLEQMPHVPSVGGYGIPATSGIGLPEWFPRYTFAYAVGAQSPQTGMIKARGHLWGAGLGTRRSLYLEMYSEFPSFLIDSRLTDDNILSAEDTEYTLRLILKGYRLYYDSSLIYKHFIPDFRLTEAYRDKLMQGFRSADLVLRKYYPAVRVKTKTEGKPLLKIGLVLVSVCNLLFGFSRRRIEKARNTLFHLLPFDIPADPISMNIKRFIAGRPPR